MSVKLLSEMKAGEKGKINRIEGSGAVHRRILEMGVTPQTMVEVQRVAPLGDPIWIRLRGYQLSLRKEEASKVYVEME